MVIRWYNVNLTAAIVTGSLACSQRAPEPVPIAANLPLWVVGDTPTLSIGVVDGLPEYQFFRANAAFRLGDDIVVANTGTREIRFFDAAGRFRAKAGGYGEGPGEFKSLESAYPVGPDSVMAFHGTFARSYFNKDGEYLGARPMDADWPKTRFPLEWWLYRRSMVVGVPEGPERAVAARALNRLPPPPATVGYWYVRVDAVGMLWVSNGPDRDGGRSSWSVFDTTGVAVAAVNLPPRFEVFEILESEVLGRWRDDLDVEHIRVYSLERAQRDRWPVGPVVESVVLLQESEELAPQYDEIQRWLRDAVTAQESFFADHITYTANRFDLDMDLPEGIVFDFLTAVPTGWLAVVAFADFPVVCGIGLGSETPPGWREGRPVCADRTVQ